MTLAEIIPSLRGSLPRRLEHDHWPASTRHVPGGGLSVDGVRLLDLAAQYGTPSAVVELSALGRGLAGVGQFLVVRTEAELAAVSAVPTPPAHLVANCATGPRLGAANPVMVADLSELRSVELASFVREPRTVLLSVQLGGRQRGADVRDLGSANPAERGFRPDDQMTKDVLQRIAGSPRLRLGGLHCATDSHLDSYLRATRDGVDVIASLADALRVRIPMLYIGAGPGDENPDQGGSASELAARCRRIVRLRTAELGVVAPQLLVDPGPHLAPAAVVVLGRVGAAHDGDDSRSIVLELSSSDAGVEPGRSAHLLSRLSSRPDVPTNVLTSDGLELARRVSLPADTQPGDVLAVSSRGRLHLAGSHRSPLVGVQDGGPQLLLPRIGAYADVLGRRAS